MLELRLLLGLVTVTSGKKIFNCDSHKLVVVGLIRKVPFVMRRAHDVKASQGT